MEIVSLLGYIGVKRGGEEGGEAEGGNDVTNDGTRKNKHVGFIT